MNYYTISGLVFDLIGVALLGVDLIRFQLALRRRAKKGRAMFDKMESDYGGIESWANDIEEQSKWIPKTSYSRIHVDDETSYNTRHALDGLREISSAVNGLAAHVSEIIKVLYNHSLEDENLASSSFHFSVIGLAFLVTGFGLQIFGAWIEG